LGSDENLRLFALHELGEMGPELARHIEPARLIEILIAMLKGPRWDVKQFAARELGKLNWQPDTDETRAFYHAAQEDWSACGKIGAPAIEPLLAALAAGHRDECRILLALGETGDPRALVPILGALEKPAVDLSNCAAEALGRLGDKRGLDALLVRCHSRGWPTRQEIDAVTILSGKCQVPPEERSRVDALRSTYERRLAEAEAREPFPDDGS
jgi:hypothetical protein